MGSGRGIAIMTRLCPGDRVTTDLGVGVIIYQVMAPPEYNQAYLFSVCLDNRKGTLGYSGTMFRAEEVKPERVKDESK